MQQCAFLFLGTQGWLWTWWKTLKTSAQKHQCPAVHSRERLADFVWGDGLTVSCTRVYQHLQGGSLPDFFCELMSLNLTLWEDLCIMSLWYLENFTGEKKKVPLIQKPANTGDVDLIPGSGISPEEVNGNPLQFAYLRNPMDRGAWQTLVHGVIRVRHN